MATTVLIQKPLPSQTDSYRSRGEFTLREAIAEAYPQGAPEGLLELLMRQKKPGTVCAMFFSGRSGSYFAQSFFDSEVHPQVLTVIPTPLELFETGIRPEIIEQFNQGPLKYDITHFIREIIRVFPGFCNKKEGQPGLDPLIAPEKLFGKFLGGLLLCIEEGNLNYEELMKILFLAYRCSRGGQIACDKELVYVWQAHVPSAKRRQWILDHFTNPYLLTMVRFPEKSLDSHLIQHAYENILRPRQKILNMSLFEQMAANHEPVGDDTSRQAVIRFEDLHHHTAFVLEKLCDWWGVEFDPAICQTSGTMHVLGESVSGARRLTASEFECRLLNYYDRLKVRTLLQEEYRAWRYDAYCKEPDFESSLKKQTEDYVAMQIPFAAFGVFSLLDITERNLLIEDMLQVVNAFKNERKRRAEGIRLLMPLYDLDALPKDGKPKA